MWIRSQDKTVLANAQGIYIDSRFSVWSDGLLLGEYSTKDKALKVLDEIQYNMELFEHELTMVFQMPTDNEVDEV